MFETRLVGNPEDRFSRDVAQMIGWSGMPNVVAPRGQEVTYHYALSCITLLKKQEIVTTNVGKREDQPFPSQLVYIPTELE